ncbi:hypothetical protein B0H13DRAFT_1893684 [Mycena leptocephala]|nr:hypothetical protein B0H13DRAFT_1893684 [Mycena leptocephala]
MYNTSSIADPGVDALDFRTTRSGRVFSEWAEISAQTFDIAMAVAHSVQLNRGHDENLAELDTCHRSTSAISMPPKTRRDRDKARSKLKRQAERTAGKAKTDILLDAHPRHPRHLSKPVSPIKATFEMRKVRIASTGWIGLRDDGVAPEEDEDDAESGPSPTRNLPDFFGPTPLCTASPMFPMIARRHAPSLTPSKRRPPRASIAEERTFHRRGNYAQLTGGNSHGGGQFEPGELVNGAINAAIFASLISNIAFIRLAGFATGLFANWAPNLFDFYVDYMRLFYKRTSTLNGPSSMGSSPPVPLISDPAHAHSAIATSAISHLAVHGGGLFRWVEHDFQTEESYFEGLSREERLEEKELGLQRACEGAAMFSTLEELKAGI